LHNFTYTKLSEGLVLRSDQVEIRKTNPPHNAWIEFELWEKNQIQNQKQQPPN
jgi:hypothetical protein